MPALLIVALLAMAADASSEVSVAFGQDENEGTVVVNANALVARAGDALLVQLRDVKVVDQPADPSTIPYVSYRMCLARKGSGAGWERAGCSDPVTIRVLVDSDRPVPLPNRKFTVPVAGNATLDGHWLVLEMTSKPALGRTYSAFSHSRKSIFDTGSGD